MGDQWDGGRIGSGETWPVPDVITGCLGQALGPWNYGLSTTKLGSPGGGRGGGR